MRIRVLTFQVVCTMLISKSMKSLQLSLNELIPKLNLKKSSVTAMAYSKARSKLSHTAFIELNDRAVVQTMYEDNNYQTWHGLRLLAVDGSRVRLPNNNATATAFGTIAYRSKQANGAFGEYCNARASVLYDVLNRVALNATLAHCTSNEATLAEAHLAKLAEDDLVIYDRFYAGYRMMALCSVAKGHFLIRCSRSSFAVARAMFKPGGPDDITIKLTPNWHVTSDPVNRHLPSSLNVRLVRVVLPSGEYEILVTSLLDRDMYPLELFLELYHYRWGIETFYGKLKTRLGLENFSGLSVEAVMQDFYVAVFLTGIETLFTEDATARLSQHTNGHPKQVNKAVSFNVIKQHAFELFMSKQPIDDILDRLTELFVMNPVLIRSDKRPPRGSLSVAKQLNHWRYKRKGF